MDPLSPKPFTFKETTYLVELNPNGRDIWWQSTFPGAIRPHQIGGFPKIKLALPWGIGGEGLFMGEESCTGKREEGSSSFLAL